MAPVCIKIEFVRVKWLRILAKFFYFVFLFRAPNARLIRFIFDRLKRSKVNCWNNIIEIDVIRWKWLTAKEDPDFKYWLAQSDTFSLIADPSKAAFASCGNAFLDKVSTSKFLISDSNESIRKLWESYWGLSTGGGACYNEIHTIELKRNDVINIYIEGHWTCGCSFCSGKFSCWKGCSNPWSVSPLSWTKCEDNCTNELAAPHWSSTRFLNDILFYTTTKKNAINETLDD